MGNIKICWKFIVFKNDEIWLKNEKFVSVLKIWVFLKSDKIWPKKLKNLEVRWSAPGFSLVILPWKKREMTWRKNGRFSTMKY